VYKIIPLEKISENILKKWIVGKSMEYVYV